MPTIQWIGMRGAMRPSKKPGRKTNQSFSPLATLPAIGAILNQHFVSIKVDREERPDIDRLYIAYVEATTGSAGWPLN
jgi:uncharacterized protein YyaL (SSP411 family)